MWLYVKMVIFLQRPSKEKDPCRKIIKLYTRMDFILVFKMLKIEIPILNNYDFPCSNNNSLFSDKKEISALC